MFYLIDVSCLLSINLEFLNIFIGYVLLSWLVLTAFFSLTINTFFFDFFYFFFRTITLCLVIVQIYLDFIILLGLSVLLLLSLYRFICIIFSLFINFLDGWFNSVGCFIRGGILRWNSLFCFLVLHVIFRGNIRILFLHSLGPFSMLNSSFWLRFSFIVFGLTLKG